MYSVYSDLQHFYQSLTIAVESIAVDGTNLAVLATAAAPDTQDLQDASGTARRQTDANSERKCTVVAALAELMVADEI